MGLIQHRPVWTSGLGLQPRTDAGTKDDCCKPLGGALLRNTKLLTISKQHGVLPSEAEQHFDYGFALDTPFRNARRAAVRPTERYTARL